MGRAGVVPLAGAGALAAYAVAVTGTPWGAAAALAVFAGGLLVLARPAERMAALPAPGLGARNLAIVAALAVFFDGLLGAVLRHLPAGVWPGGVGSLHSIGALVVGATILASSLATFVAASRRPLVRRLAIAPPVVMAAQAALGVWSGGGGRVSAEAHLALGPTLLGLQLALVLLSAPAHAWRGWARLDVGSFLRAVVELTKPRVSVLVIATFAGGLWLAPGEATPWRAVLALLGTVLIVGAANALNMYLERDIDARMRRTSGRPLPQGRLAPEVAVALGTSLACVSAPLLLIGGNGWVLGLGLFAFASYVWAYTPLKQRSPIALWIGAVPGAMPPLMGWVAATGRLDAPGLVLFAILFLWQIPHFLAIAIYRAADYEGAGFRVMTLRSHPRAARVHILVFAVLTVAASLLLQPLGVSGWLYTAAAALLGAFFLGKAWRAWRGDAAPEALARWARGLFFGSLVYLTGVFVALSVDHLLR